MLFRSIEVMRLQREAADSSGKIKLDIPRLGAEFRQDYINLVTASQQVAEIVATVTFAPRLRPLQPPDQRREAASTSLYYMPYMTIEDLLKGFASYNQVIRQVSKAYGTVLVGDADAIPADAQHYTDSVHFTDAGSVAMAGRVSRVLIASPEVQALVAKLRAQAAHRAQPAG